LPSCFSRSTVEDRIQKLFKTQKVCVGRVEREETQDVDRRPRYRRFTEVIYYRFRSEINVFYDMFTFMRVQFNLVCLDGKMVRREPRKQENAQMGSIQEEDRDRRDVR